MATYDPKRNRPSTAASAGTAAPIESLLPPASSDAPDIEFVEEPAPADRPANADRQADYSARPAADRAIGAPVVPAIAGPTDKDHKALIIAIAAAAAVGLGTAAILVGRKRR